ncbi:MAG: family 14 glycosylhydrolase [Armatimonadota bacterium]|nr:family 14 glycosylhydrolase [Armatimonadota bacterium]
MSKSEISQRFFLSSILIALITVGCAAQAGEDLRAKTEILTSHVIMPNEGDGVYKEVEIGGRKAIANLGSGQAPYLYFQVPLGFAENGDLYITIEFFDAAAQAFMIQYDNGQDLYFDGPQGVTIGSNTWVTATYKLVGALLDRRQNYGSDFRIYASSGLPVSRVEVSRISKKTGVWPSLKERFAIAGKKIRRPKGMEYTFGNGSDDQSAQLFKSLGVTSVETYVTWETVEAKAKGEWDWSKWDEQVKILKRHGLKWVPFIILGPAYSTPNWFRESEDHIGCVCLEHGAASKIESLWNPHLPAYIDRFIGEFAKRYEKTGVVESVLLGIQGDFGEAIFSVFGEWTQNVPGPYHNHPGFWCGDEHALDSFRKWAIVKYGDVGKLNTAWGTSFDSQNAIDFPIRGEAEIKTYRDALPRSSPTTKRYWLDFVEWYRGEMTRFSDWWMATTKKHFPETPVYLCTGGHAPPEHGSDFGAQCKVAAKNRSGVRITNEASNYAKNFAITRWVAAAGKHYGAFYGFEPAGGEDEKGIVARIYNATASGAAQLHDYQNNVTNTESRQAAQQAHIQYLMKTEPVVGVALFYPNVSMTLDFGDFLDRAAEFRDITDYDYVDEGMLRDGALDRYKVLVIIRGNVIEKSDFEIIEKWVQNGGVVFALEVTAKTVEGDNEPFNRLFEPKGGERKIGKGKSVLFLRSFRQPKDPIRVLSGILKEAGVIQPDGENDGVYATIIKGDKVLYLNTTSADVEKNIILPNGKEQKAMAKAGTITEVKVDG